MNRVLNKIALITGGGTGIGRATAILYAKEGASVVLMGRTAAPLEAVSREVLSDGGKALAVTGDVTDEQSIRRALDAAIGRFGRIDILVNNAGCGQKRAMVHELTDATWREMIEINLTGVFRMARAVLGHFVANRSGAIVNVSSICGLIGTRDAAAYSVAKGGVVALTRCIAAEYGTMGIRCNCICPGLTAAPMAGSVLADPEWARRAVSCNFIQRAGHPFEVAQGILYLGSDESSFVTGAVLPVDGGAST